MAYRPWVRPMVARDLEEEHRSSSPLELLFDLCFAVAVSQAAGELRRGLLLGQYAHSVGAYLLVFFSIWWAWMNFTWFASAYATDDVPYRWNVFIQIAGVLTLAAGVPRAFEHRDFAIVVIGYVVMRIGLIPQWLRAARHADPPHRRTALQFASGVTVVQIGWVAAQWMPARLWFCAWCILVPVELAVPIWAEHTAMTPWHPRHIVDRYGSFTLIVLGEGILSSTVAIQSAFDAGHVTVGLASIVVGGLLLVFSMWWLYFDRPVHSMLRTGRSFAFLWGYGHLGIFSSVAAVGAGLQVAIERATGHTDVSPVLPGIAVACPVAVFLALVWALMVRPARQGVVPAAVFGSAIVLVLASSATPLPVLAIGGVMAGLVFASLPI
jgi:low temperature requirement protein LtrA